MARILISIFSILTFFACPSLSLEPEGVIDAETAPAYRLNREKTAICLVQSYKLRMPSRFRGLQLFQADFGTDDQDRGLIHARYDSDTTREIAPVMWELSKNVMLKLDKKRKGWPTVVLSTTRDVYLVPEKTENSVLVKASPESVFNTVTAIPQQGVIAWIARSPKGSELVTATASAGEVLTRKEIANRFEHEELSWLNHSTLVSIFRGRKGQSVRVIDALSGKIVYERGGKRVEYFVEDSEILERDFDPDPARKKGQVYRRIKR